MKYTIIGDYPLWGDDAKQIVAFLRQRSYRPRKTTKKFMDDIAERCRQFKKVEVRTDSVESFVSDLIDHKFLIPTESSDQPQDNIIEFPTT